jgi:tRNA nucleotidyltransferase (CCA-adding enzyme)
MEVIVSHEGTDLDGLAAMVACAKLHPQAVMVLVGGQSSGVRRFITEHKGYLPLYQAGQLKLDNISTLYIVDAQEPQQLGELAWLCDKADTVVTYDHHPPYDQAGPGIRQQVGAVTTFLVEQLRDKQLPVSPFEATLFLLGIYEDTHCLTNLSTTPRDMLAAAWLLEQGGRLSQVSDYINIRLAPQQRDLLEALLGEARIEAVNERSVLIMAASLEQFVSGLGVLTLHLLELEDCDLALSIVKMENQVHLIARSRRSDLNLLDLFAPLEVRGHRGAVTMTFKNLSPAALYARVMELLRQRLPKGQVAGDIMSAPVKTVFEEAPIAEAHRLLLRYGHTGFPVVNQLQAVIGIVSRRDIEKAMRHNLGQAPVRNYMTRNVVTADVLASLGEVTRIIVQNNIGRVPVLDRGRLVGIITRSDLLKQIYGAGVASSHKSLFSSGDYRLAKPAANLTDLINSRLPQRIQGILMLLGQIAQQDGFMVYAVGGFVRDLLLGLPNFDLDIAVEDNAIKFARKLAAATGGKLVAHEEMGTATLTLTDGFQIDFATARTEFYQFPAATPEVEQTTIKHDLYRRDFTINTLAFALNSSRFGEFLDFFSGYKDLQAGLIRVLYNLSFVEDPTRILRAIRFACRYGFRLEEDTRILLDRALADDMLAKTPAARLGRELRQMFMEPNVPALLKMARELGVLPRLIPGLEWSRELERQIIAAARISQWSKEQSIFPQGWLLYPLLLLKEAPREAWAESLEQLGLRGSKEQQLVCQVAEELEHLSRALQNEDLSPGGIFDLLQPQPTLALLALLAANPGEARLRSAVLLYLEKLADLEIAIDGNDLLRLGVEAGPRIGRILKAVHRAKLDGRVQTQEEELALADRLHKEGE